MSKIFNSSKAGFSKIANESSWIIFGQITSVLGGLAAIRALTEYLNPIEYGTINLGLTFAGLVNQIIFGGIINGIYRYYSVAVVENSLSAYFSSSRKLASYAFIATLIIFLLISGYLIIYRNTEWLVLLFAIFLYSIASSYSSILSNILNAARLRKNVAIHTALESLLRFSLILVAVKWFGSAVSVILAYFIATLVALLSQLFTSKQFKNVMDLKYTPKEESKWTSQIWSFSWPFSLWGIFTWTQQSTDRWFLLEFTNSNDVGLYSVVYQLGFTPIGLAIGMLISLLGPILYQHASDAGNPSKNTDIHQFIWKIGSLSIMLTIFAFLFVYMFHEYIFSVFVGESFKDASQYLSWIVLAGGLFATGQIVSLKLMSEMRSKYLIFPKIGSAMIGILANYFGAKFFGIDGVVGAILLFAFSYMTFVLITAKNNLAVST